jgi:hypothetical protein
MKITNEVLRNIISEELENVINEVAADPAKEYALLVRNNENKSRSRSNYTLVLYQMQPIDVVGYCFLSSLPDGSDEENRPCIPLTFQVSMIARQAGKDYKGIGAMMYDMASTLIKRHHNGGITSDKAVSTTVGAFKVWKKMESGGNYIKRKTKSFHDEFDYEGSTYDRNDDCAPLEGGNVPASNHSLQIVNDFPYLDTFMENHKMVLSAAESAATQMGEPFDKSEFEMDIKEKGSEMFIKQYAAKPAGPPLRKSYFNWWNTAMRKLGIGK